MEITNGTLTQELRDKINPAPVDALRNAQTARISAALAEVASWSERINDPDSQGLATETDADNQYQIDRG